MTSLKKGHLREEMDILSVLKSKESKILLRYYNSILIFPGKKCQSCLCLLS